MQISKKTVKGKQYVYALDSIYINRGKTIQKNKSLGLAESTANLALKKQQFQDYLIGEEARLRIEYWQPKASKEFLSRVEIGRIEGLRASLFQLKKNVGNVGSTAMETAFLIDFIYNSNKIEGSRIPKESVDKMVRNSSKEKIGEVKNTILAIKFLKSNNFKINVKNIEKLHDILLAHEPENLKFRKSNDIVVGNSKVSDFKNIRKELGELVKWYNKNNYKLYPPEQAFLFYYKFERIHPFKDGNGRTGRLLMNEILKKHKYHPIIIWNKNRQAHMNAFQKATSGGQKFFFQFMIDQFIKTHEIYLGKINRAYNLEHIMKSFLAHSAQDDD